MLERLKEAHAERMKDPKFRSKLHSSNKPQDSNKIDQSLAVDPSSLLSGVKSGKSTKLERILKCLEGKKEGVFVNSGHRGGLTNKEKLRKKNFLMVRRGKQSVVKRVNISNSEKRWEKINQVLIYIFSNI